jgi:hypothetical protein
MLYIIYYISHPWLTLHHTAHVQSSERRVLTTHWCRFYPCTSPTIPNIKSRVAPYCELGTELSLLMAGSTRSLGGWYIHLSSFIWLISYGFPNKTIGHFQGLPRDIPNVTDFRDLFVPLTERPERPERPQGAGTATRLGLGWTEPAVCRRRGRPMGISQGTMAGY